MPGAVTATFDKTWRAGVDLSAATHPRLAAGALEQEVVVRLPASMKRPSELVAMARERVAHAPTVVGPLEIQEGMRDDENNPERPHRIGG